MLLVYTAVTGTFVSHFWQYLTILTKNLNPLVLFTCGVKLQCKCYSRSLQFWRKLIYRFLWGLSIQFYFKMFNFNHVFDSSILANFSPKAGYLFYTTKINLLLYTTKISHKQWKNKTSYYHKHCLSGCIFGLDFII